MIKKMFLNTNICSRNIRDTILDEERDYKPNRMNMFFGASLIPNFMYNNGTPKERRLFVDD